MRRENKKVSTKDKIKNKLNAKWKLLC